MSDRHIIAISDSLRKTSFSAALAEAATKLAPSHLSIPLDQRLRDIQPYDQDLDTTRPPEPIAEFRSQIPVADGLLIVAPELNHSVPGVLNWASRPSAKSVLRDKPVAAAGASPTNFGSARDQLALRQIFHATGCRVLSTPEVIAYRAADRFDANGNLIEHQTISLPTQMLIAFDAHLDLCLDNTQEEDIGT